VRTLLVVILPPGFDLPSCVPQTGEPVRIQAFVAQAAVEAIHVGILHRLARLNKLQADAPVLVVQQTFGGLLNFVPHLHVMVSAGGLMESKSRWIHRLKFDEAELMRAWRFALIARLAKARKQNVLKSSLSGEELLNLFATQYQRSWNIFVSRTGSKAYRLKHDGRYIRRPPIAQHRLKRVGNQEVEYMAKDTKTKQFALKKYTNEEFVKVMMQHVPDRGRHAMRYFGLLSPRSKARLWAAIFVLLNQRQRARSKEEKISL
jgi:hypothetical protein